MIRLVPVVFVGVVLCLAMSIVNSTFVPISKIPFYIGPCFGAVIALASSENMLNKLSALLQLCLIRINIGGL